jgi:hypothetical protein
MNLRAAYQLTKVLTFSQLRATRTIRGRLDFLRRPSAIVLIDTAAFIVACLVAQRLASIFIAPISTSTGSSLAVASFIEDNLLSASLYAFLTFLLCGFFFLACVRLRQAYWMPMPVSVKLSTATYAPSAGFLSRLGLNPTESAIVKKDFRSLSRRREMARFLAIPILIVASLLIPSLVSTSQSPASSLGIMFWFFPLIFGVTFFALFTSMISVGQEGSAVWNLYSSPLLPRELVKAKATANIILSLPIAITFWLGITLLGHTSFKSSLAILLVLAALILVESFVGLALGAKYPDFSETIRSRFIRLTGMLTGMLLGMAVAGAILVPYGLYVLFKFQWLDSNIYFAAACFASLTLTALISAVAYRACISSTKKLLAGLPV